MSTSPPGSPPGGAGPGGAIRAALGRCIVTRARRWLLAVTLLLGLLAAVALGAGLPPADRTFTTLAGPVQSLMSFTLPFLTVLLASDVRRSRRATPPASKLPDGGSAANSAVSPASALPDGGSAASSAASPVPTLADGGSAAGSVASPGPTPPAGMTDASSATQPGPTPPAGMTDASSATQPGPALPVSTTAASSAAPPDPTLPAGEKTASSAAPVGPNLLAAVLLAVVVALLGAAFCAVTLALVSTDGGPDPWAHAGMIVAGGCLVQVVANLTGTGMGLLLRPALAIPATVVPPLGLYLLLGAVDVLRPARGWLTPYAALLNLLSGEMSALMWAQWVVVAAIWAVGLNAAGWLLVNGGQARSAISTRL